MLYRGLGHILEFLRARQILNPTVTRCVTTELETRGCGASGTSGPLIGQALLLL